jgi:RNA polymerase sigma factor (sigma-70 family)
VVGVSAPSWAGNPRVKPNLPAPPHLSQPKKKGGLGIPNPDYLLHPNPELSPQPHPPGVTLPLGSPEPRLSREVPQPVPQPPGPPPPATDSRVTHASLLARLGQGSGELAWQSLVDLYWKLVYARARGAGLTHEEATDASQETFITLSRILPRFDPTRKRGSFRALLGRIARSRVVDQLRARMPRAASTIALEAIPLAEDPPALAPEEFETQWDQSWRSHLRELALDQIRSEANPRHYQIFDLCVVQGRPVSDVAQTLHVSRGFVYLAKHRIVHRLNRVAKRLKAKLG